MFTSGSGLKIHRALIAAVTIVIMFQSSSDRAAAQQQQPLTFRTAAVFCCAPDPTGCPGSNPEGIAIADVTGDTPGVPDGYPEVAVALSGDPPSSEPSPARVAFFRNTRNWAGNPPVNGLTLAAVYTLPTPHEAYGIQFADMDRPRDGKLDIVVTVRRKVPVDQDAVVILYNDGQAHFDVRPMRVITLQSRDAFGLAVGDLNPYIDSLPDIAVAAADRPSLQDSNRPQVELLWPDDFQPDLFRHEVIKVDDIQPGGLDYGYASDAVIAEIDSLIAQPVKNDVLFSTNATPGTIQLLNLGGTPQTQWNRSIQPGVPGHGIDFGALRPGDPRDVALSEINGNTLRLLRGEGLGTFSVVPDVYQTAPGNSPRALKIGRLGCDARNDIVVACAEGAFGSPYYQRGCVVVFQGKDPAANGDPQLFPTPVAIDSQPGAAPHPRWAVIAQMNAFGLNDIVVSNHDTGTISVLIGSTNCNDDN